MEKLDLSHDGSSVSFSISGLGNGLKNDDGLGIEFCWCRVSLNVKNHYFNYDMSDDECMTYGEVVELRDSLNTLINGEIKNDLSISFMEPDLEFTLYTYGFCQLSISLSDAQKVYGAHSYCMILDPDEIKLLKAYLDKVIPELEQQWKDAENNRNEVHCEE